MKGNGLTNDDLRVTKEKVISQIVTRYSSIVNMLSDEWNDDKVTTSRGQGPRVDLAVRARSGRVGDNAAHRNAWALFGKRGN